MKNTITRWMIAAAALAAFAGTAAAHGPTVPPDPWDGLKLALPFLLYLL
jgi:hypothetical protein